MTEQEWHPNAHRLEPVRIPAFTKYEPCIVCQGKGWKKQRDGYSLITCPACQGSKKLPVTNADGQFQRK